MRVRTHRAAAPREATAIMSIPPDASKPAFTDLHGQYLAFNYAYSKVHRRPTAEADMQRFFDAGPHSEP